MQKYVQVLQKQPAQTAQNQQKQAQGLKISLSALLSASCANQSAQRPAQSFWWCGCGSFWPVFEQIRPVGWSTKGSKNRVKKQDLKMSCRVQTGAKINKIRPDFERLMPVGGELQGLKNCPVLVYFFNLGQAQSGALKVSNHRLEERTKNAKLIDFDWKLIGLIEMELIAVMTKLNAWMSIVVLWNNNRELDWSKQVLLWQTDADLKTLDWIWNLRQNWKWSNDINCGLDAKFPESFSK